MKIPLAKDMLAVSKKANEEILKNRCKMRELELQKINDMVSSEASKIVEIISNKLTEDVNKKSKKGYTEVVYSFPWAHKYTLHNKIVEDFLQDLRKSGYKTKVSVYDNDLGKIDIDYWGCIDHIRDVFIMWE